MRYTEKSVIASLVFLAARSKIRVHLHPDDAKRFADYGPAVRRAIVTDMHKAWNACAYHLERPFYGNNRHGYRVCRYVNGSALREISRMWTTAEEAVNGIRFAEEAICEMRGGR